MTKTRTSRFISMLICVCMAVLCIQGLSFRAAAKEVTQWQIGDSINLAGKWVCRDDAINNTGIWQGDTCIVPEPMYSAGWSQWYFVSVLDGYNLFITMPADKTGSDTPTGFKIKSGAGTEVDPYKFELTYTHTHNYVFSADGDTITVNCDKAGCTEPPYTATMTLVAPTLTTEGGEGSPEATILCSGIDEEFVSSCDYQTVEEFVLAGQNAIVYYDGDTELEEAPTEAGDYTAEVIFNDNDVEYTATISYTIAEAESEEEPIVPAPSAPIVISGTAKAASGGAPGLVSGTSESLEMLTWNAQLDGTTLTWEAKDGADGFVISIRAKGAKAFKRFDRVTEKSADISRLKPGTYTIYVRYEKDGKLAKCRQSARTTIKIK